jgi:23S rRNA pseudouridine2457 synthase
MSSPKRAVNRSGLKTRRKPLLPTQKTILILLNKPFNTLSQFTGEPNDSTLSDFINTKKVYPAGRLDKDSEGLLLLTNDGKLQNKISSPQHKMEKCYWVQVEGEISPDAIARLEQGVKLKDGLTKPAKARLIELENENIKLWPRTPAVRYRKNIRTSWLELRIKEGKNRQVRRMTAAVGFPTLRLIRKSIGIWDLEDLQPGEHKLLELE